MKRSIQLVSVVALTLAVMSVAGTYEAAEINKRVDLPAEYSMTIQATGCTASPGPEITMQSELTLSGLTADVILSHLQGNANPHDSIVVEQVVIPDDQPVSVPTRTVVGPIGDNPFISLQLTDARGRPLTSEIFLGPCDQGTFNVTTSLRVPATAAADVSAQGCDEITGPGIFVDGATELEAVQGKLIFRSGTSPISANPAKKGEAVVDLVLLPAGELFPFPQQAVMGGGGPNPQLSLQLRGGDGEAIGTEIHLGRCVANTD